MPTVQQSLQFLYQFLHHFLHFLREYESVLDLGLKSVAVFGSFYLFVWYYHGLLPTLRVRAEMMKALPGVYLVRLQAENVSKVRARLKRKGAHLQLLDYEVAEKRILSEWVPFERKDIRLNEPPLKWEEPAVVLETKFLKPGQIISVDVLYEPSASADAVHCGFQVKVKSVLARLLYWHSLSFTTTVWAIQSHSSARGADKGEMQKFQN